MVAKFGSGRCSTTRPRICASWYGLSIAITDNPTRGSRLAFLLLSAPAPEQTTTISPSTSTHTGSTFGAPSGISVDRWAKFAPVKSVLTPSESRSPALLGSRTMMPPWLPRCFFRKQVLRPASLGIREPRDGAQARDLAPVARINAENIADGHVMIGLFDDPNPVPGAHVPFGDDAQVGAGTLGLGEAADKHGVVHADPEPPARHSRLGDFEDRAADLP